MSAMAPDEENKNEQGLGPRGRSALIAVLMGVMLSTLDTAIANVALPTIAADLHSPAAAAIWVINAYQLAVVATMLPFAALGDGIGPRRVFLGGLVLFTAASGLCMAAGTVELLAAARAFQGIGAGAMMSVNIALIRQIYPPSQLGRGVGMNALVGSIGFVIGPTVASLLLTAASWPWLFGINVPLGALAIACAWPTLPSSPPRPHGFDVITAALTATSFAALIFALGSMAQLASWAQVLPAVALTLVSGAALLYRERGHATPMFPLDLLRRPMFSLSAVTAICAFATQGLAFVSLPFYFEQALHRDAAHAGYLMSAWPVVVALAAPLAGRLSDRHPPGLLGGIGLALLAAGMCGLALLPAEPPMPLLVLWMALCGAGFGFFQAPNLKALMSSAPPHRSGGASGVIGVVRLLGQASGAALVALCFHLAGLQHGPVAALALGGVTAGLAALSSFARLRVSH
jgi:DHA2 family multidrug resistance protein-like MFS transporter